jgi:glycosyltransferase involved in cell wall biosynthesis
MGGAYLVTRKLDPYMRVHGYVFDYITMDEFVVNGNELTDPLEESRTFSLRLRKNKIIGHIELPFYVRRILKRRQYQIVHIDIDSAWKALLYAVPAKWSGAKVLVHSHATGIDGSNKGLKRFLHNKCKIILSKYADKYIGCSQSALEWLCPKNRISESVVLINGIDTKEFFYSEELRTESRKELQLRDEIVLCNVGRINGNKNQVFLIDILKELRKRIPKAILLLVGPCSDEEYKKIVTKINNERLNKYVVIVGETDQVNKYLNVADYFILPSLFEGLSLASIEAQRTGLRCLLSTGVPPESKVTALAQREPLESGAEEWAKIVEKGLSEMQSRRSEKFSEIYTMDGMANHLSKIYSALIGG